MSTNVVDGTAPAAGTVDIHARIVAGMRWTVWLAVAGAPFSFLTSALLARTSPEALGTFGVLIVYIGLVTAFLYFGGDTVTIQYLPRLSSEQRLPYLLSYFAITCLWLVPVLAVATIWPATLRYCMGVEGDLAFHLLVLYLAPVYVLYCLVGACLRGALQIPAAQSLARGVPIVFCLLYGFAFANQRAFVDAHYAALIWGLYLVLTGIAAVLGVLELRKRGGVRFDVPMSFYLPAGFWRYAATTQLLGMLTFTTQRLDFLLVLNFGGLAVLGKYVALYTVASMVPVVANLFRDTLLPSLTNVLAHGDMKAAEEICTIHVRVAFLANTCVTCALIVLALPLTILLGARYTDLRPLMVLLVLMMGSGSPGALAMALLASAGKQQRAVYAAAAQVVLEMGMFLLLWPRYGLLGAVLACGGAFAVANGAMWLLLCRCMPFTVPGNREYACFLGVCASAAAVALILPIGLASGLLVCAIAVSVYLAAAGYTTRECVSIAAYFLPAKNGIPHSTTAGAGMGER